YRSLQDTLYAHSRVLQRTFILYPHEIRLPGVVITEGTRNPADLIVRNAIAAKERNRHCMPAFRAETYTLYSFRMGSYEIPSWLRRSDIEAAKPGEVIFMSEALSHVYFAPPDRFREEIIRSRIVGSRRYSPFGSWIFQGFDPYDERLSLPELTETPFILPLARDAFLYYRYELTGSFWEDTTFFYQIAVIPLSANSPCVEGSMIIQDERYALVGLRWNVRAGRPIRYTDSMGVQMTYVPVGGCYLPGEVSFRGRFQIEAVGVQVNLIGDGYMAYRRYQVLVENRKAAPSSHEVSSPSPVSPASAPKPPLDTFRVKAVPFGEMVRILPRAEEPLGTFWDSIRQAPLDSAQLQYLARSDTLLRQDSAQKKTTSSRLRLQARGLFWRRYLAWGTQTQEWEVGVALPFYTHIEGWVLPLKARYFYRKDNRTLEVQGILRYGWGWRQAVPSLRLQWGDLVYPRTRWHWAGGIQVAEPSEVSMVPLWWNTLHYLIWRQSLWWGWAGPFIEVGYGRYLHRTLQAYGVGWWERRPWLPEGRDYYNAWRGKIAFHWKPGTRTFTTPRRTEFIPPDKPLRWEALWAAEAARLDSLTLFSLNAAIIPQLSISPLGQIEVQLGWAWQNLVPPWTEQGAYPSIPRYIHFYSTDFGRLPLYTSITAVNTGAAYIVALWKPQGALLRLLPLLKHTGWQETFAFRWITQPQTPPYGEVSFYLSEIGLGWKRTQLVRFLSVGLHLSLVGMPRQLGASIGLGPFRERLPLYRPTFP
ncbi:MAG: DUF5686 family protein, partial [Bacteroidia bacterium]|nr:DUF5686 family protein [Bacteroidia bacterium]